MRKLIVTLMVLMLALMGAAAASAGGTIKLAVMEPLSGTFKDIGDRYLEGVQYAAEVLNEAGGINGMKVEVIPVDSEGWPPISGIWSKPSV